ncbi:uncharacterized protein J3D65DRAFT_448922 [Phyllosticta citribraziliensis]|uniref:Transmembrane protein n=1 Tax=Phyllosticta citribraziliensis TaxID=989973 RepID=A0ABR1LKU7_9PEZI
MSLFLHSIIGGWLLHLFSLLCFLLFCFSAFCFSTTLFVTRRSGFVVGLWSLCLAGSFRNASRWPTTYLRPVLVSEGRALGLGLACFFTLIPLPRLAILYSLLVDARSWFLKDWPAVSLRTHSRFGHDLLAWFFSPWFYCSLVAFYSSLFFFDVSLRGSRVIDGCAGGIS